MLWQAVTLWLVNRGITVHRGRPVELVCNWKETMWYENHAVRFRPSPVRIEPGISSRSEASQISLKIWLARGCKHWHLLALGRKYGTRSCSLSEYMSLHLPLKLTTNCVPLSRIKREIHLYVYMCSSLFIKTQLHPAEDNINKVILGMSPCPQAWIQRMKLSTTSTDTQHLWAYWHSGNHFVARWSYVFMNNEEHVYIKIYHSFYSRKGNTVCCWFNR